MSNTSSPSSSSSSSSSSPASSSSSSSSPSSQQEGTTFWQTILDHSFGPYSAPPSADAFLITDEATWSNLTEDQRRAYLLEITHSRDICKSFRTGTLRGNQYTFSLAAIGSVISWSTPKHWSVSKRMRAFWILGLSGIALDYWNITNTCAKNFPLPSHYHQVTGLPLKENWPEDPRYPSSFQRKSNSKSADANKDSSSSSDSTTPSSSSSSSTTQQLQITQPSLDTSATSSSSTKATPVTVTRR